MTKTPTDKKPFTITLDERLLRTLSLVARAEGTNVSNVIISALVASEAGLKKRAQKALNDLASDLQAL